ncbi:hypothetical protein RSAG8_00423, partial [Rhizoctonia solani AG-8 WAC10335]
MADENDERALQCRVFFLESGSLNSSHRRTRVILCWVVSIYLHASNDKICPFAQRTVIALEEAKADYTTYEIDLSNKPEWYAPKVNPASKGKRIS